MDIPIFNPQAEGNSIDAVVHASNVEVDELKVNGVAQAVLSQGVGKQGRSLDQPKAKPVLVEAKFPRQK